MTQENVTVGKTTQYVVKIRNSDGLEVGQLPNNKWSVLEINDDTFEQGDTIEIVRVRLNEESERIRPSDDGGGK